MLTAEAARSLKPNYWGDQSLVGRIEAGVRLCAPTSTFVNLSSGMLGEGELKHWIEGRPSERMLALKQTLLRAGYRIEVSKPVDSRPLGTPPAMSHGYVRVCWG